MGVLLPQLTADATRLVDAAHAAEELGFDSLWLFDHLWPLGGRKDKPVLECWSTLAYVAQTTRRIGVGTLVTRSSLRHPALLEHMAATLGDVAPSRLTLGIGSGDSLSRAENLAFGIRYHTGRARTQQFQSAVEALRTTSRDGVRLWVGGRSPAVLEIAGRYADGWNGWGGTPEGFAAAANLVTQAAGGRPLEMSWGVSVVLAATDDEARARLGARSPRELVAGDTESVALRLREFVAAGAGHVVVRLPDAGAEAFERLAPVAAAVRSTESRPA